LCHLRQQRSKAAGQAQHCLSDFVAPHDSGRADYIGGFAVTAGIGIDEHVARFEADHDDYSAIVLKALADRLAEALTEYLHQQVRREYWAYAPDERMGNRELIAEAYSGIRPAPGYPACPDHTEKAKLWTLLDVDDSIDLRLTDSFAMYPTAAVSGFYFSHPESRYFAVGKIGRDQLESYAERKRRDGWRRILAMSRTKKTSPDKKKLGVEPRLIAAALDGPSHQWHAAQSSRLGMPTDLKSPLPASNNSSRPRSTSSASTAISVPMTPGTAASTPLPAQFSRDSSASE